MRARAATASENPLAMLALVAGGLLLAATVLALGLALAGLGWRGVELAGACWTLYGLLVGGIAVLDPAIDGLAHALQSAGLMRAGGGYSAIEAMVIRGRAAEAADALLDRARDPRDRVEATLRRAAILAAPLSDPEAAMYALLDLRDTGILRPSDDIRVGLALVEIYEQRGDPGSAMRELRRLIDSHPGSRSGRRLRAMLAERKP
jgi:hypothetical protein